MKTAVLTKKFLKQANEYIPVEVVCLYEWVVEYPVYGAHELADEGAFSSVVVLATSFPSGFCRGRDLNPRPSHQGKLEECNDTNH